MKLIEAFNEKETKERLYGIMNYLTGCTTVSFRDIYDRLGREKDDFSPYHKGDGELIQNFFTFPVMYPQGKNMEELVDNINGIYQKSYQKGAYFHFKSDRTANERMIINLSTQQEATMLVRDALYWSYNVISRIKFFASEHEKVTKSLKCDKMVIYYDRIHRDVIFQTVCNAAKNRGYNFKEELSAFYHIAGDNDGSYPVGIGIELMFSSFTENRTAEILEALTGVTFNKTDGNKDYKYKLLRTSYDTAFFDVLYNNITRNLPLY